jgi:protein-S-isoprenylcysteine O-methyltransferase Ste14
VPVPDRAATSSARTFAWAGAGAFVLSLSYFLYSSWIVFGRVVDGQSDASAVVWNTALFSAFALHHSVFAREPIRRRLTLRFPHLERSIYVWVASVLFIVVCWQWRPVGGVLWDLNGLARLAATVVHAGGILLSVYSAALIDVFELAGLKLNAQRPMPNAQPRPTPDSQRLPTPNAQPEEFKTTGPYGWVRHPIYLGWFLLVFAVGTMTMTRFVFAVVSCAYIVVAIPFEERSIRASSEGAYERYMRRVPRKLVPGLY